MDTRLVNVRLDRERLAKARRLREHGVTLSEVVREAIDQRHAQLGTAAARDIAALIERVFERFPDPPGLPPRSYDVHDRGVARRAIQRRLGTRGTR
jgi:hypothetical protein